MKLLAQLLPDDEQRAAGPRAGRLFDRLVGPGEQRERDDPRRGGRP